MSLLLINAIAAISVINIFFSKKGIAPALSFGMNGAS